MSGGGLNDDAARAFAHAVKSAELCDRMAEAGVDAILIKGAALKARLYERSEHRPSGDCDLLVSPTDRPAAERRLRELGFEARFLPEDDVTQLADHAGEWHRERDGTWVDLHVALPEMRCEPGTGWELLQPHRSAITVGTREVTGLDDVATAVLVGLHAAHHGHTLGDRPLEDLRRALTEFEAAVWREALALAVALGSAAPFTDGLSLLPEGQDMLAALGEQATPDTRRRLIWDDAPWGAVVLDDLRKGSPVRRMRVAFGVLFPSPRMLRISTPLARRGTSGLVAAYVTRPVRLLVRLPASLRALRRATR